MSAYRTLNPVLADTANTATAEEEDPPPAERPLLTGNSAPPPPPQQPALQPQAALGTPLGTALGTTPAQAEIAPQPGGQAPFNVINWFKALLGRKSDTSLREALEEYIEHQEDETTEHDDSVTNQEKGIIANVLKLQDTTVIDIMIPRVDIASIQCNITQDELFAFLTEHQYSRFPVYEETLDDLLGVIHIKDIIACLSRGETVVVKDLVREVPIVSPSMPVMDLLRDMRESRKHMALVVDEFGGIDGLVTAGDIVESIIGNIEDEHDQDQEIQMTLKPDGSVEADARVYLEEFEEHFSVTLGEEDKEDNDTLGGLVYSIAGRVPERGEILTHDNGMVFEVLEADARRVERVRITNIPGLTRPQE